MTDEDQINVILVEMRLMGVHPKWLKVVKHVAFGYEPPDLEYTQSLLEELKDNSNGHLEYFSKWNRTGTAWDD